MAVFTTVAAGASAAAPGATKASQFNAAVANTVFLRDLCHVDHDFTISSGTGKHKSIQMLADSTYDIGTAAARVRVVYADTLGDSGQALAIAATTVTFPANEILSFNAANMTISHSAAALHVGGGKLGVGTTTAAAPTTYLEIRGSAATSTPEIMLTLQRPYNAGTANMAIAGFALCDPSSGVNNSRLSVYLEDAYSGSTDQLPTTKVLDIDSDGYAYITTGWCGASTAATLGYYGLGFASLWLANGGVISWNNNDVTLTHSADTLSLSAGALSMSQTATSEVLYVRTYSTTDADVSTVLFTKSASATIGTDAVTAADEALGKVAAYGVNSSGNATEAGSIRFSQSAGAGATYVGGYMTIWLAESSVAPTEILRMYADHFTYGYNAKVLVGGMTSAVGFHANASGLTTTLYAWSATGSIGPQLAFARSKSNTKGTQTAVADTDLLGRIEAYGSDGTDMVNSAAYIEFLVDGTVAANQIPGRINMVVKDPAATASSHNLFLTSDGQLVLCTGDTTVSADLDGTSLLIHQFTETDGVMQFQGDGVGHGLTSVAATKAFGHFQNCAMATGGLKIIGLAEDTTVTGVLSLFAYGGTGDTAHTTAGLGLINLYASEHNAANALADVTADSDVLTVRCRKGTADVTIFIVDEDGDLFNDGAALAAFDEHDDVALVRAFDLEVSKRGVIRSKWDQYVQYHEADLVEAGILGAPVAEGGLVCVTQLQRLHNGAIWQLGTRQQAQEERVAHLEAAVEARDLEIAELRREMALLKERN